MEKEILYGGMEWRVDERDYLLGATTDLSKEIALRYNPDNITYEYNQLDLPNGKNSCTIHAAVGAISDLFNYKFSLEERQEIWDLAISEGAFVDWGWYINSAVKLVAKWWNTKFPERKVLYFRLNYQDEAFWKALSSNHSLVGGYRGNQDYNIDSSDGFLAGESFSPSTYGHAIRLRLAKSLASVLDNYKYKKEHNQYTLGNIGKLVENKVFYDEFYIYLPETIMTQDQMDLIEAQKLGLFNGERLNDNITRQEVALMMMRLKKVIDSNPLNIVE